MNVLILFYDLRYLFKFPKGTLCHFRFEYTNIFISYQFLVGLTD